MLKHKSLTLCVLAASFWWARAGVAQPQDAGQPRAGVPLTPEQAQEFERANQEKRRLGREKAGARARRTPSGALYQLAYDLSTGDLASAARSIEGEHNQSDLALFAAQLRNTEPRRAPGFDLIPLFSDKIPDGQDEFQGSVAILIKRNDPLDITDDALLDSKTAFVEDVTLRRGANREWKVVPRAAPGASPMEDGAAGDDARLPLTASAFRLQASFADRLKATQSTSDGFLNTWVRTLAQPRAVLARPSIRNVKQIMLGMLQLCQDYDDKFDFTPATFRDRLEPYLRNRAILLAPAMGEGKPFPYTLNPNIAGKSLAAFAETARTIAIYEADAEGKPLFRFEGKAVIGFADGQVKLTTPEEAEKLLWKP